MRINIQADDRNLSNENSTWRANVSVQDMNKILHMYLFENDFVLLPINVNQYCLLLSVVELKSLSK